jgi:hypothetical protein
MGGCGVATIARFQGGPLAGQELELPEGAPLQSYIETGPPVCTCGTRHTQNAEPHYTYGRAGTGYRGETRIIIYRLEE